MKPTTSEPISLDALRAAVAAVCAGWPVARVQLFGSQVEGRARGESDVDLLVEFETEARVGLFEMGDLKEALEERIGRRVDLVSRRAIERSRNPYRRRAILAAPITVYAR
ncbi:MAG: nucleotidyltransferase domain-containing protein [Verrucomicrobiae bacterium]|nr:nucleotidyltransferase domain-containing protein [Verrucomicrobiae bacterium]